MTAVDPTVGDDLARGAAARVAARWDVPLRALASGPGALAALPRVLDRLAPLDAVAGIALVLDDTPKTYRPTTCRDGEAERDVEAAVRALLPDGVPTRAVSPLAASWRGLDPSGRLGAECWSAVERKFALWAAHRDGTARFLGGWGEHEDTLRRYAYAPEVPARALAGWGAPLRFCELTPAVAPERVRWALRSLPFMRDRFTLPDLLLLAGAWTDDLVDRVLDRAARAGGGL